jgi:HEAT repeat protein
MALFGPPNIEKLKAKGNVKGLIKAMDSEDEAIREEAIRALGAFGDAPEVQALVAETIEAMSIINLDAPTKLLCLLGEPAVQPVIDLLKSDREDTLHQYAAYILGEIQDPRAVEPLIETLKNEKEAGYVKARAAKSLARLGDPRAIEPLLSLIPSTYPDLQKVVIQSLGAIGDPRIIEPLCDFIVEHKPDFHSRDTIAEAWAQVGEAGREKLTALSESENFDIQVAAKMAIKKLG